jgi:hypothetical protein
MTRTEIFRLVILMSFLGLSVSLTFGQVAGTTVIESTGGATCEAVAAAIDGFVQNTKLDKAIIGIVTVGQNENRSGLTVQRLRTVRNYFSEHLRNTRFFRKEK